MSHEDNLQTDFLNQLFKENPQASGVLCKYCKKTCLTVNSTFAL